MKIFPLALEPTLDKVTDGATPHLAALPPLSLYIHYPWCVKKCPYCDFNSHALSQSRISEKDYLAALLLDLERQLPLVWGRTIHTIFIGGGTPNLLSEAGLNTLLSELRAYLPLAPDLEITLEANPGADEEGKLRAYRDAGVNRLSIGVQSFNNRHLQALGRIHSASDAITTIEKAGKIFPRINIDLMYALPEQTVKEAESDMRRALSLGVTHISAYQLTLEPNTWFYHHPPALPDDDLVVAMEECLYAELAGAGLKRYEISAFAAAGEYSRHNLNYWEFGDYLGIGAGAHGKISTPEAVYRTAALRNPNQYVRRLQEEKSNLPLRPIPASELVGEFMLNALRLVSGFSLALFTQRTGLNPAVLRAPLTRAEEKKWLTIENGKIIPTPNGLNYLNNLLELFLL